MAGLQASPLAVPEAASDADESEWPDDGAEAAYLSEAKSRGEAAPPAVAALPLSGEKLPALEELVARVPAKVRDVLDDLFRAKFTTVRRFPPPAKTP